MKLGCALLMLLAVLTLNCGGDQPPPQAPSTTPPSGLDADGAAPQAPAPPPATK